MKKEISLVFVINLVLSLFAVSFLLSFNLELVNATEFNHKQVDGIWKYYINNIEVPYETDMKGLKDYTSNPPPTPTPIPAGGAASLVIGRPTVQSGTGTLTNIALGGRAAGTVNYNYNGGGMNGLTATITQGTTTNPLTQSEMADLATQNAQFRNVFSSALSREISGSGTTIANFNLNNPTLRDMGITASRNVISGSEQEIILSRNGQVLGTFRGSGETSLESLISPTTATPDYKSWILGSKLGWTWGNIVDGLTWAGIVFGGVQLLGGLIGMNKAEKNAISIAAAAGIFSGKLAAAIMGKTAATKAGTALIPWGVGIGVGILVFALLYKKSYKAVVLFECKPWEAPTGGADCEKCNSDLHACSEYRCKSLGQACQLLNSETENKKCVWVNPYDVSSPTIDAWYGKITEGYEYKNVKTLPPGLGMEVKRKFGDGCVQAFTPLEFGIKTNEPAQCKVHYNHTAKFDDMIFYFGENSLYDYNHSQIMRLPGPSAVNAVAPEIKDDGEYTLYVRCRDANGNYNEEEFAIRFCVEKGPDTTPPKIEGTSIGNNMPIAFNTSKADIEVYVNEPSECKWSRGEDRDYEQMETSFSCSTNLWEVNAQQLYVCKTTLTGLKNKEENKFYFRCKDQPGVNEADRNVNRESYVFTIIGTQPLNILKVGPNETIKGSVSPVSVYIEAETANGYKEGEATCYYSLTGIEKDYVAFYETNSWKHKQRQDLTSGNYTYYVKCVDLGGNADYNSTSFYVDVDNQAPIVVRAYQDENKLKITTDEDSECTYSTQSCNFKFEEGINMPKTMTKEHYADWNKNIAYYVKCRDGYKNEPDPSSCSIVVKLWEKKE